MHFSRVRRVRAVCGPQVLRVESLTLGILVCVPARSSVHPRAFHHDCEILKESKGQGPSFVVTSPCQPGVQLALRRCCRFMRSFLCVGEELAKLGSVVKNLNSNVIYLPSSDRTITHFGYLIADLEANSLRVYLSFPSSSLLLLFLLTCLPGPVGLLK